MRINHIGIACKNLAKSKILYQQLGFVVIKELVTDELRNLDYLFLKNESIVIELIGVSNKSLKSDIDTTLESSRMGCDVIYHTCYESDNLMLDIQKLKNEGFKLIKTPEKAIACNNRLIAFLFHSDIGIIELIH